MFLLIYFSAIVSLVFVIVLQYLWRHREFYKVYNKIPLAKGNLPIIGFGWRFFRADPKGFFKGFSDMTANTGPSPRRLYSGPASYIVVDDPEQLQKILTAKHCTNKIFLYKKFVIKSGLIIDDGPIWRPHRKAMEPAFNLAILKSFMPIFNEKTKICMAKFEEKVDKPQFNVLDIWERLALDNILTTSLGINDNVQLEKDNEYLSHVVEALRVFATKVLSPLHMIDWIFRWTKTYQLQEKHITNGLFKMGDKILLEKQKFFAENPIMEEPEESKSSKPEVFIDQLLKMREAFSTDGVRDEVNTMVLAGFETISSSLALLSLLLAIHPHIQEKIYEELQTVFTSADEEVSDEHLKQLTYMDLVIKETMRFWPPIPHIARCLSQDMELGGYTIPSRTNVLIPVMHIHRNKAQWGENAEEFKPERFETENFKKVHPYAYMPFSKGPRNCIGYNYAMNSLKVVLAHFYRKYKASTTLKLDMIEFEYSMVLKIAQGYMISLETRNFQAK